MSKNLLKAEERSLPNMLEYKKEDCEIVSKGRIKQRKGTINTKKYFTRTAINLEDIRLSLERNVDKSKRQAELIPPVISRIKYWISNEIRKIWEPRIIKIAKAWKDVGSVSPYFTILVLSFF